MTHTTFGYGDEQRFGLGSKAAIARLLRTTPFLLFASLWLGISFGGFFVGSHHQPRPPGMHWDIIAGLAASMLLSFGALSALNWTFCLLQVRSYRIALRNDGIVLDYGVVNQRHEVLLLSKIQDILITRGVIERLLGLSTLIVQNSAGTPVTIPGLDAATAEILHDQLLSRASS